MISQEPVAELLRGHVNLEIRAFVNVYMRHLQERREDITGEMEGVKLIRDDLRDQAGMDQIDAQLEGLLGRDSRAIGNIERSLRNAENALILARGETAKLLSLFETSEGLRPTIRSFNKFFTALMEGRISPGQEAFSDFLKERVLPSVPALCQKSFGLYISLLYGDPRVKRAIPLTIAESLMELKSEVLLLIFQASVQTTEERKAFRQAYIKEGWERFHYWRRLRKERSLEDMRSRTSDQGHVSAAPINTRVFAQSGTFLRRESA